VTGTLGLLLLAKARGHVARVAPALDALSDQGFHMSGDLRRAVLEQAGEG
jgi:predicted nucleic acid-binding protein